MTLHSSVQVAKSGVTMADVARTLDRRARKVCVCVCAQLWRVCGDSEVRAASRVVRWSLMTTEVSVPLLVYTRVRHSCLTLRR